MSAYPQGTSGLSASRTHGCDGSEPSLTFRFRHSLPERLFWWLTEDLYPLFIGLLQTCFAPEDKNQWLDYWQKIPEPGELKACFEKVMFAFELDVANAQAFFQLKPNTAPYQLTLPFSDHRELLMDILKHGSSGEIIEPEFLRQAAKQEIQAMAEIYKNN